MVARSIDEKTSSLTMKEVEDVSESVSESSRLQQMSMECPPFYKNRNLFILYLLMIPGCLVPAVTLGFDSAMMNGLQSVPAWDACKFWPFL